MAMLTISDPNKILHLFWTSTAWSEFKISLSVLLMAAVLGSLFQAISVWNYVSRDYIDLVFYFLSHFSLLIRFKFRQCQNAFANAFIDGDTLNELTLYRRFYDRRSRDFIIEE